MKLKEFNSLLEKFLDADKFKNEYIEIYKNPTAKELRDILKEFNYKYIRGVVSYIGDLFVLNNEELIHAEILKLLDKKNILEFEYGWFIDPNTLKNYLCVVREDNGIWYPADSYSYDIDEKYFTHYKKMMEKNNYKLSNV